MQNSVPKGEGGMLAVLGLNRRSEKILNDNKNRYKVKLLTITQIANSFEWKNNRFVTFE